MTVWSWHPPDTSLVLCPDVGGRGTFTYMNLPRLRPPAGRAEAPSRENAHDEERALMKIAPWYLAALAPFAAIGYSGAHLGHAFVVLLTIAIFLGTLTIDSSRVLPGPKTDP